MTLEYDILNQKITSKCNNYYAVADSVNYLKLDFNFTADWQGFSKLITFRNGLEVLTIELTDSCIVPWEVIKTPSFMFSIVGTKDGVVITTDTMKVIIRPSGDKDGCDPKPPTPEFWQGLSGGDEGQVLIKNSDENFDYAWGDLKDLSYDGEHTFEEIIDDIQNTANEALETVNEHVLDTNIHVTLAEKSLWNSKERADIEKNYDLEDSYTLVFTKL